MNLETLLCRKHDRKYSHLVGNATAGIYLALKAFGLEGKRIAIPNSVCANVPMAVLFSGNDPVYLDISGANLGLEMGELLANADTIDAVIPVHAYGSVCNIAEISHLCSSRGLPLIEDAAAAQGAEFEGRSVGSSSDIAVVSFGAGKIIDVGSGGAILTDDKMLFEEVRRLEKDLGVMTQTNADAIEAFGRYHTELYNNHYGSDINEYCASFKQSALQMRPNYLHRYSKLLEPQICRGMRELGRFVQSRSEKAGILRTLLAPHEEIGIKVFEPPAGSVYWRFNIFVEHHRNELLRYLLTKNYKVSSWFPSADLFFEDRSESGIKTEESDYVGDHILNIWVNQEVDLTYLQSISNDIVAFLCSVSDGLNS